MVEPSGAEPSGAAPGWYPDPQDPSRWRHWDGRAWSRLTSAERPDAATGGAPPPGPAAPAPPATDRTRRTLVAVVAAAVVLLVGIAVLVATLRDGDDEPFPAASASTTTPTGPADTTAGTTTEATPAPGATSAPPSGEAGTTTPPAPDATTTIPPAGDGAASACGPDLEPAVDAAVRSYPPLSEFAPRLVLTDVRCEQRWAVVAVAAPDTDSALAVLERTGEGWTVLLVGDAEPCAGLGIPDDVAARLDCPVG